VECNRKTDKTEVFADDGNVFTIASRECLFNLNEVLLVFGGISGLKVNNNKTAIMFINAPDEAVLAADELGFHITNEVTMLGMKIDSDLTCLTTVHEKTIQKMRNISTFWTRFSLSLAGRLNIVKTFLLAQIGYIGCFITPTERSLQEMRNVIGNFIKQGSTVALDRVFLPIANGGLGIPDPSIYCVALQSAMVKLAVQSIRDNWRYDLTILSFGNTLNASPMLISPQINPVLHGLATSWGTFKTYFWKEDSNYKKSWVLYNTMFRAEPNSALPLEIRSLPDNDYENLAAAMRLRYCDLIERGHIRPIDAIPCRLNGNSYLRLMSACLRYRRRADADAALGIENFVHRFAKGSKPFRKVIERNKAEIPIHETRQFKSFLRTSGLQDNQHRNFIVEGWKLIGINGLPNNLREFTFNFFNNTLPTNTRTSHYVPEQSRGCVICRARRMDPLPDESFEHLFFTCDFSKEIFNRLGRTYLNTNREIDARDWVTEIGGIDSPAIVIKMVAFMLIWRCKEVKKGPSFNSFNNEFIEIVSTIFKTNKKLNHAKNNSAYPICRNFRHGP